MPVWSYKERIKDIGRLRECVNVADCVFCGSAMLPNDYGHWPPAGDPWMYGRFETRCSGYCTSCGWWATRVFVTKVSRGKCGRFVSVERGAAGRLKGLDLTEISTPLDEVRGFLLAKYKARFGMNWRLFEETVADVFRLFGYRPRVTGRSNDGGIDVILDGRSDSLIGVQVKRYKNDIEASQIRELTGALVQQGITRGVFVTTSNFKPGAVKCAGLSSARGTPIQLVDAERFYDALRITKLREGFTSIVDVTGGEPELVVVRKTKERKPLSETPEYDPGKEALLGLSR